MLKNIEMNSVEQRVRFKFPPVVKHYERFSPEPKVGYAWILSIRYTLFGLYHFYILHW